MQLKRNKEMEFETLKKNYKKQMIIGALAVCVIGGVLTFTTSRAKYKLTQDINIVKGTINYKPYDFKVMAMYKSDDKTNYNEINKMPGKNYKINEEKSYCTIDNIDHDNEAKLYTNKYGEHIIGSLSKTEKCYVYFDKNTEIVSTSLGNIEVNNYQPYFSQVATTDEGVFKTNDNDGVSYYWRGATTTNYLQFGGYCWRIVRINGDGTIRLIYDGTTCHTNGTSTAESIAKTSIAYNSSYNNSSYVGWTYTASSQRPDNNLTGTESNAKTQLESWYSSNIAGIDDSMVADGKYCNDRNAQSGNTWSATGSTFYYAAYKRINTDYSPILACNVSDVYTLKVGLITVDEAMYAGGTNINNSSYYLYNGQNYWTMSPIHWNSISANMFFMQYDGYLARASVNNATPGLRPVINLKSDVTISSGDGTLDNPYVVE